MYKIAAFFIFCCSLPLVIALTCPACYNEQECQRPRNVECNKQTVTECLTAVSKVIADFSRDGDYRCLDLQYMTREFKKARIKGCVVGSCPCGRQRVPEFQSLMVDACSCPYSYVGSSSSSSQSSSSHSSSSHSSGSPSSGSPSSGSPSGGSPSFDNSELSDLFPLYVSHTSSSGSQNTTKANSASELSKSFLTMIAALLGLVLGFKLLMRQ